MMSIGTRSILFGTHQFAIHPWFVAWAWWRLHGFPWDPRLWVAFFVHDLGYWGKPNMEGLEGERHPEFGARLMSRLFDSKRGVKPWVNINRGAGRAVLIGPWGQFSMYHSRYLAKRDDRLFSRLCVADKLAIALTPPWLYLSMARATGELEEYMAGQNSRTPACLRSPQKWYHDVQRYCEGWVREHAALTPDTWTGTKKDLALLGEQED